MKEGFFTVLVNPHKHDRPPPTCCSCWYELCAAMRSAYSRICVSVAMKGAAGRPLRHLHFLAARGQRAMTGAQRRAVSAAMYSCTFSL
jgi:hypothetical protein